MPTITLNQIDCIDPKGRRDDMILVVSTEEVRQSTIWGPHRMRKDDSVNLEGQVDPIVYDQFAVLELFEDDPSIDDSFGSMSFGSNSEEGTYNRIFPSHSDPIYRLSYTFQNEPSTTAPHRIQLISLTCDDPVGVRDEVQLMVNNIEVLPPTVMKKDWTHSFHEREIAFYDRCFIVWQKTRGFGWIDAVIIRPGAYQIGHEYSAVFNSSNLGGGTITQFGYTLVYRMLA